MLGFNRKYSEIVPDQPSTEQWNEIILDTGEIQSTLQDVKVPENASGFVFKNPDGSALLKNRFIYWITTQTALEMSELSLDADLKKNNIRFKCIATTILSSAVYETSNSVVVLVATISSVHRFDFPHPKDWCAKGQQANLSIFASIAGMASTPTPTDAAAGGGGETPFTAAAATLNGLLPTAASCYYAVEANVAYFALSSSQGIIIYQLSPNGYAQLVTLKTSQIIPRFFTNIFRGKSGSADSEVGTSLIFDEIEGQVVVYVLHRDNTIRLFTTKTGQCLSVMPILSEEEEKLPIQKNLLRRSNHAICVFLCYSRYSEFRLLKPLRDAAGNYSMVQMVNIPAPQYDIIDFEVTDDRIWALWCSAEGDINVSTYPHCLKTISSWVSSALEPFIDRTNIVVEPGMDPKFIYCNHIFHSGKFQNVAVLKALMMFSRTSSITESVITLNSLKERVCQAVDTEIQNEIALNNLSNHEYLEISARYWEKFFFCCEQYHMEANQPIGIFVMPKMDLIGVVKKNVLSFLRPCDDLENGLLTGTLPRDLDPNALKNIDMERLLDILSYLEKNLPEPIKVSLEKRLRRNEMPSNIAQDLVIEATIASQTDTTFCRELIDELLSRIKNVSDAPATIIALLDHLRLNQEQLEMGRDIEGISTFCGSLGASLVAETVRQLSEIRFILCRNLLLVEEMLIQNVTLNCNATEIIRSRCMPETVIFLQAYFVMMWVSDPSTSTTTRRRFGKGGFVGGSMRQHPTPLLHYFVQEKGLSVALESYSEPTSDSGSFHHELVAIADIVCKVLWPVSGKFTFGEWLSGTHQHILIEEYVYLLNSWCEWNSCSRNFILALSYLHNGLISRALDLFLRSTKGVLTETFLTKYVLQQSSSSLSSADAFANYYLKVIKLLEKYAAFDAVIEVAQVAIGASDRHTHQAMFQSILFNSHMHLSHYEEAYSTLASNCEPSRRKDCLRQLICALIGQRRFDILLQFSFIDAEDDVQAIIESRARSMQVDAPLTLCHYDFLYAFHIRRNNMRRAAVTMYEKAMRCAQLSALGESLELRYDALLACINALSLVDREYQFVARPVLDDYFETSNVNDLKQVAVLNLDDLRQELLLADAAICVERYKKDEKTLASMAPADLLELLNAECCYSSAFKLAKAFKLDLESTFESLTLTCVQAQENSDSEAWNWLGRNVLTHISYGQDDADLGWRFLQDRLEEESTENTAYYKIVARKMMSHKKFLPLWLYRSYKKRNLSELLHLYIQFGRLDEALDIAIECLNSLIAQQTDISRKPKNVYLPLNNLDLLKYMVDRNLPKMPELKEKGKTLDDLLKYYFDAAERLYRHL